MAEQATYASASAFGESTRLSQRAPLVANQPRFQSGNLQGLYKGKTPFFNPFNLTKEEYQIEVDKATATLNSAKKALTTAQNRLDSLTTAKNKAQTALDASKTAFDTSTDLLDSLKDSTDSTSDSLDAAKEALDTALDDLTSAKEALQSADELLNRQTTTTESAQTALATAQANLSTASSNLQSAQTAYNLASTNLSNSLSALQSAQSAYDSSQVPNPNYVSPYTTNVIPNLLFNSDFSRGNEGWSGVSIGWQNSQPGYFNGNIAFSYMNQTVEQGLYSGPFNNATLTLSAEWFNDDSNRNITDSYSMTVSARDINQNPVGSATFTSNNTRHNWETKSVTLVATGPVSYITVSFSGIDNGFWAGNYGPRLRNPQLQVSSQTSTNNAQATQTGTINVNINEGDQQTFTAPNGGTFISSNLRYEAIDDATCGADISPTLGGNTITLAADNGVWGDPCGGWYKRISGTLTYSTAEPQFIKDPALYTALQTAQSNYDSAQSAYETAQSSLQQAQSQKDAAQSSVSEAQPYVTDSQTALSNLQSSKDLAASEVSNLQSVYESAQSAYEAEQSKLEASQSKLEEAQTAYEKAEATYETAQSNFDETETEFESASLSVEEATSDVEDAQQELDSIPEPEEPEEPKAPEIPEGDPKDLTEEEVTELVAEAEAVLESAEQGSPAYEQALEALAVAADADDPEISAELAAIPLLGDAAAAALEVLNNLGNVGADMAPAVREEAEKTVIASVIATGAAVNAVQAAAGAAAAAATTASTSTSGSTSGGGGGGASGSSSSSSTRKPRQ
jgi:predicted  nucleic acid-binding Zn-ribbon protein